MKRAILAIALLTLLIPSATSWAISSEPVYITSSEQLQALKANLEGLQKLLNTHAGLFESQVQLKALVDSEVGRLASIKRVDAASKIDVTKLYRALDAEGKALAQKNRDAGAPLLERMADCIDLVSTSNDYKPRWKW